MAPKRSEKSQPSTSTPGTPEDVSAPKPPKAALKTGEQLEYLLSQWTDFVANQTAGSLDRFWPRVYDPWYQRWPISPTPQAVTQHGSLEKAKSVLRLENNQVRITDFYAQAPDFSYPSSEDPHLVPQPVPSKFQSSQVRFATEPERETKTSPCPGLLYLCLEFWSQGGCDRALGAAKAIRSVRG